MRLALFLIIASLILASGCVSHSQDIVSRESVKARRGVDSNNAFKPELQNHTQKASANKAGEEVRLERHNMSFIKLVSSENCMYQLNPEEVKELKALHINGVRICPLYSPMKDGSLREDVPEWLVVELIRRAHHAGLGVFLEVNAIGRPSESGEPTHSYATLEDLEKLYNVSLHWAMIADKENVELFSPLNEPNIIFSNSDLLNEWIAKSKELSHVFSGSLVLKLADIGPSNLEDLSGYDYLAFDIMWGDANYNELKNYMRVSVEKGNRLKDSYGLKGFFFGELGADNSRVSKEEQAEIFKTMLEETWGKVDGYCFLGWSDLEFSFRRNKVAKDVIAGWYAKL